MAMETRKCTDTMAGLSAVSTVIPPSTACSTTLAGCAAASQTRSARRSGFPSGPGTRNRHAAMKTATATAITTNVRRRLPNSIQVFAIVWPGVRVATRLLVVQSGQSGQPSPDSLSRTAAPVTMIPALATTPANARRRIDVGVGCQTKAASRATVLARGESRGEPGCVAVRSLATPSW
jgi:hypothetical protein